MRNKTSRLIHASILYDSSLLDHNRTNSIPNYPTLFFVGMTIEFRDLNCQILGPQHNIARSTLNALKFQIRFSSRIHVGRLHERLLLQESSVTSQSDAAQKLCGQKFLTESLSKKHKKSSWNQHIFFRKRVQVFMNQNIQRCSNHMQNLRSKIAMFVMNWYNSNSGQQEANHSIALIYRLQLIFILVK